MGPWCRNGLLVLVGSAVLIGGSLLGRSTRAEETEPTRLAVVWTSGDPEVAHRMTLMFTHASARSGWFDENVLIVWGPSSRLLAADKDIQQKVRAMREDGVRVRACVVCAESYGVADTLRGLGIEVAGMGVPLTRYIQDDDWDVVTF